MTNFIFEGVVKDVGASLLPGDMCNRQSGVTDKLEFGLCEALYTEVITVSTPFYTKVVSQPLGVEACGPALGCMGSEASHTTREELSWWVP